jgi:formylglycine-generating enzyme required for sulfatase activity
MHTAPQPASTRRRWLFAIGLLVLTPCLCIAVVGILVYQAAKESAAVAATAEAEVAATVTAEAAVRTPPVPIKTWTRPIDGADMVYVPAGEFLMGSSDADPDARPEEQPQHTVHLDAFWIDRTEVTEGQWRQCAEAGACPAREDCSGGRFPDHPEMPATCVTWDGAQAYAEWVGGRLPTEAEWEKAARGTAGRLYPWGDNPPDRYRAKYASGLLPEPVPVGTYPLWASPYGALDMAGNVREWVADWHDDHYYDRSGSQDPQGPEAGAYRGVRGGSWSQPQARLRAASRDGFAPGARNSQTGFRVVVAPGPLGP